MRRVCCAALTACLACAALAPAQEGIQRGTLKKVDPDKGTVTVTSGGEDRTFVVTDETKLFDAKGATVRERLVKFKEGAAVFFKPGRKDGRDVLVGLKLVEDSRPAPPPRVDTARLKPLTEMGEEKYQGKPGGLYPGGANERPPAHEKAGRALAGQVRPLDADGKPSADGKIVLLSVGMSNTTQEFSTFKQVADRDADKNPRLVLVDGAQGGMTAARIQDPDSPTGKQFWGTVDQRLQRAGVTRAQVQVAWLKEADAGPSEGFPKYARTLQAEMARIVQRMHERFPNLRLVYLSSRIYAGYAKTRLNPEPYAYESGFAVKWLIEQQIEGDAALNFDPDRGPVRAPWLSWGPYLWANGTTRRADGLSYEAADLADDGTHPSPSGRRKVAEQLLRFFKTDATAKPWFLAR